MNAGDKWEASVLEQARAGLSLNEAEQMRHRARLEFNLSRGVSASVAGDVAFDDSTLAQQVAQASRASERVSSWIWKAHPYSLLTGGILAGAAAGLFLGRGLSTDGAPASEQPRRELPRVIEVAPVVPTRVEHGTVAPEEVDAPAELPSRARVETKRERGRATVPSVDPDPETTFYEELSYLRRAQAALREGNPTMALGIMTTLDEMQKVGALDVERRMTKALALCELGRTQEARAISAPLLKEGGTSVYAERLRESCVGSAFSLKVGSQ